MSLIKSVLNLAKISLFLLLEAPIRPRWAYYRARGFLYNYLLNRRHQNRLGEYAARIEPLEAAVASATGATEEEVAEAATGKLIEGMRVHNRWVVGMGEERAPQEADSGKKGPIEVFYGPSPQLFKSAHMVTRLLKPEVVIETGVAKGFTSAAILDALDRNGKGKLYSVEMPSLYIGYTRQVGERIPDRLRARWTLELGPSAVVLPRLLDHVGPVDVFLYDSAASYDNQLAEFSIILRALRPGGVVIADLLMTDAFIEVAEANRCRWTTTEQTKVYPLGLLTKLA